MKLAIFYDIENFDNQEEMLEFVQKKFVNSSYEIIIQRAYSDWSDENTEVKNRLLARKITPIHVISHGVKKYGNYTNAADIAMAVDVIDVLYTYPSIEGFVIVSGDGGMINLINKLNLHKKTTISIASRESASQHIFAYAKQCIIIEDELEQQGLTTHNQIIYNKGLASVVKKLDNTEDISIEWANSVRAYAFKLEHFFQVSPSFKDAIILMIKSWNEDIKQMVTQGIKLNELYLLAIKYFNLEKSAANKDMHKIVKKFSFVKICKQDGFIYLTYKESSVHKESEYIYFKDGDILEINEKFIRMKFLEITGINIEDKKNISFSIDYIVDNIKSISGGNIEKASSVLETKTAIDSRIHMSTLKLFVKSGILMNCMILKTSFSLISKKYCRDKIVEYIYNTMHSNGIFLSSEEAYQLIENNCT